MNKKSDSPQKRHFRTTRFFVWRCGEVVDVVGVFENFKTCFAGDHSELLPPYPFTHHGLLTGSAGGADTGVAFGFTFEVFARSLAENCRESVSFV